MFHIWDIGNRHSADRPQRRTAFAVRTVAQPSDWPDRQGGQRGGLHGSALKDWLQLAVLGRARDIKKLPGQ
eukprot:6193746-Pleurochrysis_carterae.AAC.2